jgi:hypothetical protein
MYALVLFLIVGGTPVITPVGPFATLSACQVQLKEAQTIDWPDEVEGLGLICLEIKAIKHA